MKVDALIEKRYSEKKKTDYYVVILSINGEVITTAFLDKRDVRIAELLNKK
jgi:hypothetical protein